LPSRRRTNPPSLSLRISIALLAFGLDSAIEGLASVIVAATFAAGAIFAVLVLVGVNAATREPTVLIKAPLGRFRSRSH
jgi:hypothetical protein